jgi:putative restriction endonuclease
MVGCFFIQGTDEMPSLPKVKLLQAFEDSLRISGWNFLFLSEPGEHPARYNVFSEEVSHRIKVYIWTLTHGGGAKRPANEYRIQITGLSKFEAEVGGKTLILGYWADVEIFAAFDFSKHSGRLGASPSIQVRKEALTKAHQSGFGVSNKGNGELAVALRPEMMGLYIHELENIHGCGSADDAAQVLEKLSIEPDAVLDRDIDLVHSNKRRTTIANIRRTLRDVSFRRRVLNAYSHTCAVCGIQLELLDAAHILPVADPSSTDETANGIALCVLHHRAYDLGFVTFDESYSTVINQERAEIMKRKDRSRGLAKFVSDMRSVIMLPPDKRDHPRLDLVRKANTMRGWK